MVGEKTPIKIRIIKSPSMFSISMEGLFYYGKIKFGVSSGTILSQFGVAFGAFVGAMITTLCGSFSSLIIYFSNKCDGIKTVIFGSMGSLASSSWTKVPIMAVVIMLGCILFLFQYRVLNTRLLWDESTITLGIDLSVFRKSYMIATALVTGTLVAYTGMFGFVGLIIPHICRSVFGEDYKR